MLPDNFFVRQLLPIFALLIWRCRTIRAEENLTTVIVCEGRLASLHCPAQHEIAVRLANFGRFAVHPCNPTQRPNISTQCLNPQTLDVLRARCEHRQRCVVPVNWATFPPVGGIGEQCPGTPKYLETVYGCVRATTTTTTTTMATSAQTMTVGMPSSKPQSHGPFDGGGQVPKMMDQQSSVPASEPTPNECSAMLARDLHWPATAFGKTARMQCPAATQGHAEWHCSNTAAGWQPEEGPNMSRCISEWARLLREDLEDDTGLETSRERRNAWLEVLREAHANVRRNTLYGGDLRVVGELVARVVANVQRLRHAAAGVAGEDMQLQSPATKHNRREALELAQQVVDVVGNLLRFSQRPAWLDLSTEQRQLLAAQLMHAVAPQTLAMLLPLPGWPKAGGSESVLAAPTLVAEVAQASIYDYVPFPSMSLYRQNFDTVLLPREVLQLYGQELSNVFYVAWDRSIANWLLGTNNYSSTTISRSEIISKLISVAVVPLNGKLIGPRLVTKDHRPVVITFQNGEKQAENARHKMIGEPRCVWWDPDASRFISGTDQSHMSEAANPLASGCTLAQRNLTHTICECRRMNTHFALMADFETTTQNGGRYADKQDSLSLIYTMCRIGAAFSAICVFGALLASVAFLRPPARTKGQAILYARAAPGYGDASPRARCHLCVQMLAIQCVLVYAYGTMTTTQEEYACPIIAFLLQYLVIAFACCMLLDALQVHATAACCTQRAQKDLHWLLHSGAGDGSTVVANARMYLFGYGLPLLLLPVSLLLQNTDQTADSGSITALHFCWLRPGNFGLATFVVPLSLCLIATVACLLRTVFVMNTSPVTKQSDKLGLSTTAYNGGGADYRACSQNGSTSSDSAAMQRAARARARQRVRWACARAALAGAACSAAIGCSHLLTQNTAGDELRQMQITAAVFGMLNALLGVQILAEVASDKKIRVYYRRWRLNGGGQNGVASLLFVRSIDVLCCCRPGKTAASNTARNSGGKLLQLAYSPNSGGAMQVLLHGDQITAAGGGSTASSSASSNNNKSACSDDVSSLTAEMAVSSSGDTILQQTAAVLPPPAPLLQLYQEHHRQQLSRNNSQSPHNQQQQSASARTDTTTLGGPSYYGENGHIYDYATIPYEALMLNHPQYNCRNAASARLQPPQASLPRPVAMPRLNQQQQQQLQYSGMPYSARRLQMQSPQLVRVLQAHAPQQPPQVQLIHPDQPPLINGDMMDLASYYHHRMAPGGSLDELAHGLHPPPNFPPPPPPAPFYGASPVHFRRASDFSNSCSATCTPRASSSATCGSTLLLRMDLSRPEPVFMEQEEEEGEDVQDVQEWQE